jgi:SAM-dependent methyltransferase
MEVSDIARCYRRYGIDVDRFFSTQQIELVKDADGGFFRFTNCTPGDSPFYADIMGKRGYQSAEKREFVYASQFIEPQDCVLDVGCGEGKFAKYCGVYKGIDTNPDAISAGVKAGRNVFLESLESQPHESFDVVVLFQVLEHVPDPRAMLMHSAQCLRPGGRLVVSVPSMAGFMGFAMNQELNYPPHHLTWWDANALTRLLEHTGLQVSTFWHEPLQREHLAVFLFSLFLPRREQHFDFSPKAKFFMKLASVIARLAPRSVKEYPQALGHTTLAIAKKRPSA